MSKKRTSGQKEKVPEALQRCESWLRLIMDNTTDGINVAEYDPRTKKRRLVICNDRYVEMSGRSREELMAAEDLNELIRQGFGRRPTPPEKLQKGQLSEGISSWLRPDGKENFYEWTSTPLKVGDKYSTIGIDRDITERMKADEKLRRMAMIAEQAAEGIAMAGLDGILQFVNAAWARMHGYETGQELVGKHLSVCHTPEQMGTYVNPFNDEVNRNGRYMGESEQTRKDGTTFPSEMTVSLFKDEEDNPIGFLAFAIDITERKKAEESLRESEETARAILGATLEAVLLIKPDGTILEINEGAAVKGFGKTVSEMIGKNICDTDITDMAESRLARAGEVVRSGKPLRFEDEDRGIWLDHSIYPVFDAEGKVVRLAMFVADITERRLSVNALQESEDSLRMRVRELNCLYQITEVVNKCGDNIDTLLQGIADTIPESCEHPENACARITFGEKKYATGNFRESPWKLAADILIAGGKAGIVEVFFLDERPTADENLFLKEEASLMDAVAAQIGRNIERILTQKRLVAEQSALHEKNVALREVTAGIRDEKKEFGRRVVSNVEKIVMPLLHTLEHELPQGQRKYLDLLKGSIEDITLPFADNLSREFASLTPAEIRICNLIRRGMPTKQIADLHHISPVTVNKHREHIRRKLQITNKNINLVTYLKNYMSDHPMD